MTKKNLLRPFSPAFHCLIWITYLLWIGWGNVTLYGKAHLSVVIAVAPIILGLVYLHRYWFRMFIRSVRKRWQVFLWTAMLMVATGSLVYLFLYTYPIGISRMILPDPDNHGISDYMVEYLNFYWRFAGAGIYLGASEILVSIFRERIKIIRTRRREIATRKKQIQLKRWLSHFVGNLTHGAVYSLETGAKPQQVKASLAINAYGVRLLSRENVFQVSLKEEFYYLKQLADVFAAFPIELELPPKTYNHHVLPMALLALYKNICKHGAFGKDAEKARFQVITTPDSLLVSTQNTISSEATWIYGEGGTGLEQLERLLSDNYGGKALFDYSVKEERFELRLEISYNKK